jgi:hypothetical protein
MKGSTMNGMKIIGIPFQIMTLVVILFLVLPACETPAPTDDYAKTPYKLAIEVDYHTGLIYSLDDAISWWQTNILCGEPPEEEALSPNTPSVTYDIIYDSFINLPVTNPNYYDIEEDYIEDGVTLNDHFFEDYKEFLKAIKDNTLINGDTCATSHLFLTHHFSHEVSYRSWKFPCGVPGDLEVKFGESIRSPDKAFNDSYPIGAVYMHTISEGDGVGFVDEVEDWAEVRFSSEQFKLDFDKEGLIRRVVSHELTHQLGLSEQGNPNDYDCHDRSFSWGGCKCVMNPILYKSLICFVNECSELQDYIYVLQSIRLCEYCIGKDEFVDISTFEH